MPDRTPPQLETFEDYCRVLEELRLRLTGDSGLAELALEIEQVVRFELEQSIPPEARFSPQLSGSKQPSARRTALISDIHGNQAGLLTALADIDSKAPASSRTLPDHCSAWNLLVRAIPCVHRQQVSGQDRDDGLQERDVQRHRASR